MSERKGKNITVKEGTYVRLLRRKTHPRDSMDMVIVRLLDNDTSGGK